MACSMIESDTLKPVGALKSHSRTHSLCAVILIQPCRLRLGTSSSSVGFESEPLEPEIQILRAEEAFVFSK